MDLTLGIRASMKAFEALRSLREEKKSWVALMMSSPIMCHAAE